MIKCEIREYLTRHGANPFRKWLLSLDRSVAARIQARLYRFELGNLGDVKSVGCGVFEARFNFGSGYRVYFGKDGARVIILLCGGSKSSQERDIKKACSYWADYWERSHES